MESDLIVVEAWVPTADDDTNLREDAFSFALDQRTFGPRRLLVAFADEDGTFRGLVHARRTDPPERALEPCVQFLGRREGVCVAFCDEPVDLDGPPPRDLAGRFALAAATTASHGIHLVDWFACDDLAFRSFRLALHPEEPWWNLP